MILKKVQDILSKQFGLNQNEINLNNHVVKDLGADSLDLVEIVMEIEEQFKIKVEEAEYENATTVEEIVALIATKLQKNND